MGAEDYATFKALNDARRELRRRFAAPCPECQRLRPKTYAKMLLPGQTCKMHDYTDPRPRIDRDIVDRLFESFGIKRVRNHEERS